ncbi:MAG TPA: hypothetical protein VMV69_29395 [Pirellulales bacterium]|nr:hypothetical protein [Pirellulales bacterium]
MSRPPAGALGPVWLLDGPAGLSVEDAGAVSATRRRVRLTFDGERYPAESVIELAAEGAEQVLSFKLVVQP